MAAGLPCIASRIRGNTDLIEEPSLLFSPEDEEGFAGAISSLLESGEKRTAAGERNKEKVKEFSVSAVEKELIEIYSEVL